MGGPTSCNQGLFPPPAALGGCIGLLLSPPEDLSCWELAWLHQAHTVPEELGQAGISLPSCHLLPDVPLSLLPTPLPSGALTAPRPAALALLLQDVSAWGQRGGPWDASEGRNPRTGSAGRRSPCANPPLDGLGPVIPFPLTSQGDPAGHQEVGADSL